MRLGLSRWRIERLGLLEGDLLMYDDGGVGCRAVDIPGTTVVLDLLHQGADDEEDSQVEEKVGDRDPILA